MRAWLAVVVVAVAAGCGAARDETSPGALSRYGLQVDLPAGWDGRIGRGAIHAANFPLPSESSRWLQSASTRLGGNDVLVLLFERDHGPGDSPPEPPAPELEGPLRIEPSDFSPAYEVVDDDHGHGRRLFSMSGRDFVLFVETGAPSPSPDLLAETNRLLTSLRVEAGDFYRGTLEPARFPMRPGWDVGNSGARDARADGDWLTSWAATIPYADDWNVMHGKTLERLPRDGIVIWMGLERNNRFPPQKGGDEESPEREQPFQLDDFERQAGWEGGARTPPVRPLGNGSGRVPRRHPCLLRPPGTDGRDAGRGASDARRPPAAGVGALGARALRVPFMGTTVHCERGSKS